MKELKPKTSTSMHLISIHFSQHRTEADYGANTLTFRHNDVNEVCRRIYEIQTNTTGLDAIPISFVKLLCLFILPLLVYLLNFIIDASSFPSTWIKGIFTPIPNSSNPTKPKDFRPISVLPKDCFLFLHPLLLIHLIRVTSQLVCFSASPIDITVFNLPAHAISRVKIHDA